MSAPQDRKVVLIIRQTRLEGLIQRFHTLAQARFYVEHLGADFSDYLRENEAYDLSLKKIITVLQQWGRYQIVERKLVPNYCFSQDDIVVTLGQDGLVANVMKYLHGQPIIGINPEPSRWDGILLPFQASDLKKVLSSVAHQKKESKSITMAQVTLSDGQVLYAVNDFFIGPKTHTSALYEIKLGNVRENQSSSGIIISTGLGSTAWLKSILTGAASIAHASERSGAKKSPSPSFLHDQKSMPIEKLRRSTELQNTSYTPLAWDSSQLAFVVREPFPSQSTQAQLVYGQFDATTPLHLRSHMPENGIIFSDGMHQDYIEFNAGIEALVTVATEKGMLVV